MAEKIQYIDTTKLGSMNSGNQNNQLISRISYATIGSITLSHDCRRQLAFLNNICRSCKIEAIDIFIQGDILCLCGIAHYSNMHFMFPILNKNGGYDTKNADKRLTYNNENVPTLNTDLPIIRTSTPFDFLGALALFPDNVTIDITEGDILLQTSGTRLYFDKIATKVDYLEYENKLFRICKEEISVEPIMNMTKAIFSTTDATYTKYVVIKDSIGYTNTLSFVVEAEIKPIKHEYFLTANILSVINKISTGAQAFIGYSIESEYPLKVRDQRVIISVENCYLGWELQTHVVEAISNLLLVINRKNYTEVMKIHPDDWKKLDVICKYSEISSGVTDRITFRTLNEGIVVSKDRNTSYIRGTSQPGVQFDIELGALKRALTLTGSKQPEMFIDFTAKDTVLLLKGLRLVAIKIHKLTVDASGFKFAKSLGVDKPEVKTVNMKEEIAPVVGTGDIFDMKFTITQDEKFDIPKEEFLSVDNIEADYFDEILE